MRYSIAVPGFILLSALSYGTLSAQDVGATVSLTGCLAREADGEEVEYLLEDAAGEEVTAAAIELVAGEGVSLEPHVGHTVEATGVVIPDDEGAGMEEQGEEEGAEEEAEEEGEDADEILVRVTELGHIAASCDGGR